jgi:hypothetical protein
MEPEELEELEDRLGEMVDPREMLGRHRRASQKANGENWPIHFQLGLLGASAGSSSRQWPNSMDSGVEGSSSRHLTTNSLLENEEGSSPGRREESQGGAKKVINAGGD